MPVDLTTVGDFKLHVEKRYGIEAMDQVWLAKDRDQPLQDDASVCDCISADSEVHLLVERKVNERVLEVLPKLRVNDDTVTFVSFCNAALRDVDAEKLAEALKVNTAVTELYLQGNNMGAAGCAALAEALKVNTAVIYVDLDQNNIGDAGCAALAEALKVNTAVKDLNLQGNKIGDAGCAALAEALKVNTGLTYVSLDQNNIGDAGRAALAEALKVNTGFSYSA
jgi:Ran GTPase-activating protein (RanGAP) involved in mRNA processing and transport